jgi:hypothetical protein
MQTLSFEPLIPPALWVTLLILTAGLLVAYGLKRPTRIPLARWTAALALTALGAALVLLVLLNPTWVQQVPPPAGKPLLTLLVDTSGSMATPDTDRGTPRVQVAAQSAAALARDLADQFEVRAFTFDALLAPAAPDELSARNADGPLTDLAAALRGGLAPDRPQGQALALLSDGIHNAGDTRDVLDAARLADGLAAPVYTLTVGGQQDVRDVALSFASAQELASVRQTVPVRVVVRQRGFAGATVTVTLRHADAEVGRQEVVLSEASPAEVRFDVQQEQPGLYRYEAAVAPLTEEVTRVNNTGTFVLRVVDRPIRVLLLEGKPYWDPKFLMRTLASDPLIELHSIVRLTDRRLMERTLRRPETQPTTADTTAPATQPGDTRQENWRIADSAAEALTGEQALRDTQIIVLGRDAEAFLTEPVLARLRDWIARDGGALVCYRGSPVTQVSQQLAQLLPVRWAPARESRFHPRWTERGRELGWLPQSGAAAAGVFSRLPTLATVTRVERPKPLAVVLAAAASTASDEEAPAVTYQPYGAGRVVVIEGAGMWRWAFLAPQYHAQDDVYADLWHSLLRWLVSSTGLLPGQTMSLRSDKVTFGTTENCSATLLLRDAAAGQVPTVELTGDALPTPQTVTPVPLGDEPDTYRVPFGKLPDGRYQARIVAEGNDVAWQTTFDVRSLLEEQLDVRARPDIMERIAADSGGAVLGPSAASEIATHFRAHLARSRPPRVTRITAWDRWWLLTTVLALWTVAWGLRRSGGLI